MKTRSRKRWARRGDSTAKSTVLIGTFSRSGRGLVYKKEGNVVADFEGPIGQIFSQLAETNCRLWHAQEKVYEFERYGCRRKTA